MTASWSAGYVAKTKIKHPQPHCFKNLALRILLQSFAADGWDCMDMYSMPHPVIKSVTDLPFPGPEGKEGLERHGLNVSRLISINAIDLDRQGQIWLLSFKVKIYPILISKFGPEVQNTLVKVYCFEGQLTWTFKGKYDPKIQIFWLHRYWK